MLELNTVFVLGAGASAPYGFPLGRGLTEVILQNLADLRLDREWMVSLHPHFNTTQLSEFREALRGAKRGSIDAFLDSRRHFVEVGKACIARALIPYEHPDRILDCRGDDWYEWLWGRLYDPVMENVASNPVTFVTFNYDRSLEYALYLMTMHTFGCTSAQAVSLVKKIKVIHVHGSLGPLPWEDDADEAEQKGCRPFTNEISAEILKCWQHIRIVHECKGTDAYQAARVALRDAEVVCFVGFGFHHENVSNLQPARWRASASRVATGLGLPRHTRALAEKAIERLAIGGFDEKTTDFLNMACP